MVVVHAFRGLRKGITEIKRLSIDSQIKSAHGGYWDQGIGNIGIQHKSSDCSHIGLILLITIFFKELDFWK